MPQQTNPTAGSASKPCVFTVLGGDRRQSCLAQQLAVKGHAVSIVGFEKQPTPVLGVKAASRSILSDTDVLILPLPVSVDGRTVNAPFSDEVFPLDAVFFALKPGAMVFGGRIDGTVSQAAQNCRCQIRDYYLREELMVKNAIPTAEGALQIAMEETAITIHQSRCLVLGFGRVARAVAALFHAAGAKVTVAARRYSDFAWMESLGYQALDIRRLGGELGRFDVILNTVPAQVLGPEELSSLKRDALVIDLSSKPGGVDFEAAKEQQVRVVWALSLPGRVAPVTSGRIIGDTICNMLEEEGIL